MTQSQSCMIITGPTGVGKTACVDQLAQNMDIEVINADMGQMYTPLSIGTAKPDWRNTTVPHHLFDIIDEPRDCTVTEYRERALHALSGVWRRQRVPVLVGGSLFYIKSLFFPPSYVTPETEIPYHGDSYTLWQLLQEIDPERANAIHPHDTYRVKRALAIWYATGYKPSSFTPQFMPPSSAYITFLTRDREDLYHRIDQRVYTMLENGWLDEVQKLSAPWKTFLQQKHILGYPEVIAYLENEISYDLLVEQIQKKTRSYAKRQITFWRSFGQQLTDAFAQNEHHAAYITSVSLSGLTGATCADMMHEWYQKGRCAT